MASTTSFAYSHSQSSTFVSDKMRALLKDLLARSGLNPQALHDAWNHWVERAARTWLESEDLLQVVIEFYDDPNSDTALDFWESTSGTAPGTSTRCGPTAATSRTPSLRRPDYARLRSTASC
jgi:hypothetical protein